MCGNCQVIWRDWGQRAQLRRKQRAPSPPGAERRQRGRSWQTKDLPVLSCSESSLSPRSATLVMFSLIMPTVSSICAWMAAVFAFPWLGPAPGFAPEPFRGRYGSYGSDLREKKPNGHQNARVDEWCEMNEHEAGVRGGGSVNDGSNDEERRL